MGRNYKKEYDNYHSRPEQKIRRAARNAARRLFTDADPDKDVHHKDNNPLNNDKKNLSLVTQYYNRREPRLRKEAEFDESIIVVPNEVAAVQTILDKFAILLKKSDFKKKQKLAKALGIKVSLRGKHRVSVEDIEEEASTGQLMAKDLLKGMSYQKIAKKYGPDARAILMAKDLLKGMSDQKVAKKYRADIKLVKQAGALLKKISKEEVEEAVSHNRLNTIQKDSVKALFRAVNQADGVKDRTAVAQSSKEMEKGTRAFQLHFYSQNPDVQEVIAKAINKVMKKSEMFILWDAKFSKRVASFGEDMGTTTGTHIAGTGDDSSTVIVKKKKKVYRREALKKRIIDNVLARY